MPLHPLPPRLGWYTSTSVCDFLCQPKWLSNSERRGHELITFNQRWAYGNTDVSPARSRTAGRLCDCGRAPFTKMSCGCFALLSFEASVSWRGKENLSLPRLWISTLCCDWAAVTSMWPQISPRDLDTSFFQTWFLQCGHLSEWSISRNIHNSSCKYNISGWLNNSLHIMWKGWLHFYIICDNNRTLFNRAHMVECFCFTAVSQKHYLDVPVCSRLRTQLRERRSDPPGVAHGSFLGLVSHSPRTIPLNCEAFGERRARSLQCNTNIDARTQTHTHRRTPYRLLLPAREHSLSVAAECKRLETQQVVGSGWNGWTFDVNRKLHCTGTAVKTDWHLRDCIKLDSILGEIDGSHIVFTQRVCVCVCVCVVRMLDALNLFNSAGPFLEIP